MVYTGDLAKAKPMIEELQQQRLDALKSTVPDSFVSFALPIQRAELNLRLAKVYVDVNEFSRSQRTFHTLEELSWNSILSSNGTSRGEIMQKSLAARSAA